MERDELELISVNLKEAVGRGDFVKVGHQIKRLDKLLKKSLPSEEGNFKWYKLGANDEANELYDPTNPEVSFNTRRQLTK